MGERLIVARAASSSDRHASESWHLAVLAWLERMARGGWTYIMTNKPHGMLYTGVTADLAARVSQHRGDRGSAFCRRYGLKRLVLAERHDSIQQAIIREKQVNSWRRDWKVALIEAANPFRKDLFDHLA